LAANNAATSKHATALTTTTHHQNVFFFGDLRVDALEEKVRGERPIVRLFKLDEGGCDGMCCCFVMGVSVAVGVTVGVGEGGVGVDGALMGGLLADGLDEDACGVVDDVADDVADDDACEAGVAGVAE
jgi:hypothetical protein